MMIIHPVWPALVLKFFRWSMCHNSLKFLLSMFCTGNCQAFLRNFSHFRYDRKQSTWWLHAVSLMDHENDKEYLAFCLIHHGLFHHDGSWYRNIYSMSIGNQISKTRDWLTLEESTLSQAAACDGPIYTVNFNTQNSDVQGYPLPLFEDQN